MRDEKPRAPRVSHRILGVIFVGVVAGVFATTHQLIIPIFLGLITWGKLWLKALTPKLGLLLFKNSVFMQLRRLIVRLSAHLFVKSHKPWRRFFTRLRLAVVDLVSGVFQGYLGLPLWMRTTIAIAVLVATAGSSFAIFALLIIPQPLLDWLRMRLAVILNQLGVTKALSTLWNTLVPRAIRHRWYMYVKWKLGRQQVTAARRVYEKMSRNTSENA